MLSVLLTHNIFCIPITDADTTVLSSPVYAVSFIRLRPCSSESVA